MSTIEEQIVYLGVKIGELCARIEKLEEAMNQMERKEEKRYEKL